MMKDYLFNGIEKRKRKYRALIYVLVAILLIMFFVSLSIGDKTYSFSTVIKTLLGTSSDHAFIIKKLRLTRAVTGILAGMAFGAAGYTFQTLLGTPLASPDIIGVSSGSTVAAVFSILVLHLNRGVVSLIAVAAGICSAALIYRLSNVNGFSQNRLILTGIGVQAFFAALINWMLLKAAEYDVPTAMRWMAGNLNGIVTESLPLLCIVVAAGLTGLILLGENLKSLSLGDAYATVLGVNVNLVRGGLIIISVMLISFATAITGPIAAVSFLAGPIAARLFGNNRSNVLPAALIGAILVLFGDFVGENLLVTRYPVGVITGMLGAPYLIYLLIKQNAGGKSA